LRVSFRGARNFPPELSNNFFFVAPIKTEKFSKSLSGFSTTFRLFPALESSSSMSFWSNKTEDGNKQFPTCSVRYVLSVESMIRWRWIALVGVFNLRRGRWWSSDTWNQVLLLSPLHTFRLVLPCFHSAVVPRVPDEIGVGRVPVDDVVVVGWLVPGMVRCALCRWKSSFTQPATGCRSNRFFTFWTTSFRWCWLCCIASLHSRDKRCS